jgi:1-acyl-sn-glycerol-3-phosphate acyltransferase
VEDWQLKPARDLGLPFFKRFRSLQRESGLPESVLRLVWWSFVRGLLKTVHRLEVEGREHLPEKPPFVLVANHSSHLDALVLASSMPVRWRDCVYPLAAGDTFFSRNATAAFAATLLNAFPVWRKRASASEPIDLRRRLLEDRCVYIIFPEGTRSRDGSMGRFKAGVGMLVAGTPIPVVPCRLVGAFEAFPPGRRLPRLRKVKLRIGEPVLFESHGQDHDDWRAIAATLEERVRILEQ